MKKKILFATILLSVLGLTTSCIKENDFDALKHPIYIQGTFNPNLGLPIGSASLTIQDMLGMFKQTEAWVEINPTTSLVTVHYDTIIHENFPFDNGSKPLNKKHIGKGGSDVAAISEKTLSGELTIDLFDNVRELSHLNIRNLQVSLLSFVKANTTEATEQAILDYGVEVYFDSVHLKAFGKAGNMDITPQDTLIKVSELLRGDTVVLFDKEDISNLVNIQPKYVQYAYRMRIVVPQSVFANIENVNSFMNDTMKIESMDVDASLDVNFPLSVSVDTLSYNVDLDLNLDSVDLKDLKVDSSSLILEFVNGLPVGLEVGAQFKDKNTGTTFDLFDQAKVNLASGIVSPNAAMTGTSTVSQPTSTTVRIPLTNDKLQAFLHAEKLSISSTVSTADYQNGTVVSVQGTDALQVRLYAQIQPNLTVNIPIIGNGSNDKSSK